MNYIFDLDGTLALIEHRRHFVEGPKKDWRGFFAACVDDEPNVPVMNLLRRLRNCGSQIEIWSGRSDEVRIQTEDWLRMHDFHNIPLRMRQEGDHQPDVDLKRSWLLSLSLLQRAQLEAVFDDRASVVAMWRSHGVPCFQVAEGNF